jgi:hypothetical protein
MEHVVQTDKLPQALDLVGMWPDADRDEQFTPAEIRALIATNAQKVTGRYLLALLRVSSVLTLC